MVALRQQWSNSLVRGDLAARLLQVSVEQHITGSLLHDVRLKRAVRFGRHDLAFAGSVFCYLRSRFSFWL
jgi:hypothetical protein